MGKNSDELVYTELVYTECEAQLEPAVNIITGLLCSGKDFLKGCCYIF